MSLSEALFQALEGRILVSQQVRKYYCAMLELHGFYFVLQGKNGVVSAVTNVVPGLFGKVCENAYNKNWQTAVEIDNTLRHL